MNNNNNLTPNPDRMPDGKFAKGNQVTRQPYTRYADRVQYLQENLTAKEIMDIANNPKKLMERSVRDAMIIRQMAMTFMPITKEITNADVRMEREALIDRLEGKPKGDETSSGNHVTVNLLNFDDGKPIVDGTSRSDTIPT